MRKTKNKRTSLVTIRHSLQIPRILPPLPNLLPRFHFLPLPSLLPLPTPLPILSLSFHPVHLFDGVKWYLNLTQLKVFILFGFHEKFN